MRRKHQKRVLINLLAIAVLALFLWVYHEYPLPTQEMEFHRTERQRLAEESVIILHCESGGELGDPTMLVGVTDSAVHTSSNSHLLNIWPKVTDSPTLVVLPSELEYHHQRISNLTIGLAAVEPPSWAEDRPADPDPGLWQQGSRLHDGGSAPRICLSLPVGEPLSQRHQPERSKAGQPGESRR